MTDIGPVTQQGIVSTQAERVQNDRPTAVEAPREPEQQVAPPPPPVDSGRGATLDTTA